VIPEVLPPGTTMVPCGDSSSSGAACERAFDSRG
jgi:hypothetical protein